MLTWETSAPHRARNRSELTFRTTPLPVLQLPLLVNIAERFRVVERGRSSTDASGKNWRTPCVPCIILQQFWVTVVVMVLMLLLTCVVALFKVLLLPLLMLLLPRPRLQHGNSPPSPFAFRPPRSLPHRAVCVDVPGEATFRYVAEPALLLLAHRF